VSSGHRQGCSSPSLRLLSPETGTSLSLCHMVSVLADLQPVSQLQSTHQPFGWYRITLLHDRGTCTWISCSESVLYMKWNTQSQTQQTFLLLTSLTFHSKTARPYQTHVQNSVHTLYGMTWKPTCIRSPFVISR